ncbi:permease, partial [bacterium]|nr:permease [bacterium]
MKWLNRLLGLAFSGMFGETFMATVWGKAVQFFIYDTIKIIFLLCLLIFIISYIQSYYPPERTKKILGKYKGIGANAMGALLGTVTPFCSCSSIPLFMGFTSAGLSSGVTFSFLISSPLVDLGALIILVSVFGFPIAIVYVIVGLILAVIGGTIIEKTGVGKNVREFVTQGANIEVDIAELTKKDRAVYAKDRMLETLKKVWPYILIGVGIGAAIHNFIPENWIQAVLGQDKWYS